MFDLIYQNLTEIAWNIIIIYQNLSLPFLDNM